MMPTAEVLHEGDHLRGRAWLPSGPRVSSRTKLVVALVLALLGVAYLGAVRSVGDRVARDQAAALWSADDAAGIAWLVGLADGVPTWTCQRSTEQLACAHAGLARFGAIAQEGPLVEPAVRADLDLGEGLVVEHSSRWSCARPDQYTFTCERA